MGRRILVAGALAALVLIVASGYLNHISPADDEPYWPQPFDTEIEPAAGRVASAGAVLPAVEAYMDRIRAAELQADAIAIEMLLHMVYVPRLVPGAVLSDEAADAARDSLLEIRRDVEAVAAPAPCHAVQGAFLDALEAAAGLYDGIQGKDRAAVRRDLGQAQDAVRRFRALAAALRPLPDPANFRESQPRLEDSIRDLRAWRDAPYALPDELIEQFNRLAEQGVADDDPALIAIMDQMTFPVRVLPWEDKRFHVPAIFDRPEIREWDDFYPLLWILLGGQYHPFMYDAFVAWRSAMQAEFFGFSNFSQIPNAEYNEVRLSAVRTIQAHLRAHPDDDQARAQKRRLLDEPNLQRGGVFGQRASACPSGEHGAADQIEGTAAMRSGSLPQRLDIRPSTSRKRQSQGRQQRARSPP